MFKLINCLYWESFLRRDFLIWKLFFLMRTFVLILLFFLFCFSNYVSIKFHLWPSSSDELRSRIGMQSLVTVSPGITAFHSCCLSHHVFDQVTLWLAWVGIETAIFWLLLTWNRIDSTPLSAAPRVPRGDQSWIFWSYKSKYLFSLSGLLWLGPYRICNCLHWESFLRWGFLTRLLILLWTFVLTLVVRKTTKNYQDEDKCQQ